MLMTIGILACATALCAPQKMGVPPAPSVRSTARVIHTFERIWEPSSPNRNVFVLGDTRELGGGDLTRAVRLLDDQGIWRARISLPANREITYRFYERSRVPVEIGDPENGFPISESFTISPLQPTRAKSGQVHSKLESPALHWRYTEGEPFRSTRLHDAGPGRFSGERLWRVEDFGQTQHDFEFFLLDANGQTRDPVAGVYRTALNRFFLQDGELFSYFPAATVSRLQRAYDRTQPPRIDSRILGESRRYRVMLPRGYREHTRRRYPVLYIYDGQRIWDYGIGSWDRNGHSMAELVRSGLVRESIQVAIDFVNPVSRIFDTLPPDDFAPATTEAGRAHLFLRFLTEELKPRIDAVFRTSPARADTYLQGFSMGGLLSVYAAWDFDDRFGGVAAQSAALVAAPRFYKRLLQGQPPTARIYIDVGDLELPTRTLQLVRTLRLSAPPWIPFRNIAWQLGAGHMHFYGHAAERMESFGTFLLPVRTEPESSWNSRP